MIQEQSKYRKKENNDILRNIRIKKNKKLNMHCRTIENRLY